MAAEAPILSGMAGRYATALFDLAIEANAVEPELEDAFLYLMNFSANK